MAKKQQDVSPEYAKRKEISARCNAEVSQKGRDIAPIPKIKNPRRRNRCKKSLRQFCQTYFKGTFQLKWAPDHLKIIARIEKSVIHGGLFALAMPRGMGKTSLCEVATLWALANGYHRFVALIGADLASAVQMLDSIKSELEQNELLLEDFPEICYPIVRLDGIFQRTGGQILHGKPTRIGWTSDELILPTVPGSGSSGGIIRVAGVAGRIRGMKFKRPDGTAVRPSLVILDDPQTDESARSPMQIANRLELLNGAILGLAGPDQAISAIMPCTVIYPGDMADQILDRSAFPAWQGERTKMVYEFPVREDLWEQYVEIRNVSLAGGGDGKVATKFYRKHRKEMDMGAEIAWPQRYNKPLEISAVQHAMNLLHRDKGDGRAFWSEYQNEPLPPDGQVGASRIEKDSVLAKIVNRKRGIVPAGTLYLTSFVDVQGELLYWMVCAWLANFSGTILNYGVWPPQPKDYFLLSNLPVKLSDVVKGAGLEGRLYEGMKRITDKWLAREWQVEQDGGVLTVERALFDANWGQSTDAVYQFTREHPMSAVLLPSHGKYFGASTLPMGDYKKIRGDKVGLNWRVPARSKARRTRYALYDTNFWKSFVRDRFGTAMGDSGSLTLFEGKHALLLDQLASEFCVTTQGRGRTVEEWKMSGDMDNHWLDCLVGCAVGASMQGAELFKSARRVPQKSIKLSELLKKKQQDAVGAK